MKVIKVLRFIICFSRSVNDGGFSMELIIEPNKSILFVKRRI